MNKIAIYIENGMFMGARSNLENLDIEVIDADSQDSDKAEIAENRWTELQTELKFGY